MPLILGGGDVMAAAETGSGKTGAFALPVIQIVHETLIRNAKAVADMSSAIVERNPAFCALNIDDRDEIVAVGRDGLSCQSRSRDFWGGIRATVGAFGGKVYFEVTVKDEGLCRVGWSMLSGSLDIGTDAGTFGFGGTGKKSHSKKFEDYGEPFGLHDVIGCWLDCDQSRLGFCKNGKDLGTAFEIPPALRGQPLFPSLCLKNAEVSVNFGGSPLAQPPPDGFIALARAHPDRCLTWSLAQAAASSAAGAVRHPLAIVVEPSRDLAEQTHVNMAMFARHLSHPEIRTELFVGGTSAASQIKALASGVDIVVGTPGRIVDLVKRGDLAVESVKFFVLDEADRLLDTGNKDDVMTLYRRLPKVGSGESRLQVLMFSATLHSAEIRELASRICQDPVFVDLKGREHVPDTVDHLVLHIDPREDRTWLQSEPNVITDGVHTLQPPLSPTSKGAEAWSEAIKRLKPRLLQRLVDALNMEQALIFCRTNFDCDNLEKFFNDLTVSGAGKRKRGIVSPYSCLVLAGQRSLDERRAALKAFKEGEVRFLIATDVAARGIDIQGLPFVINMTLPDRSEDYIHRVGRVGRADAIGLAISIVSDVPEKVWFCTQKGLKPWLKPNAQNTKTTEQGGHTIWYEELALLKDVEARLHRPLSILPADLTIPEEIASKLRGEGAAKYGESRGGEDVAFAREVAQRAAAAKPAVQRLDALEHQVQKSFYMLKEKWREMQMAT